MDKLTSIRDPVSNISKVFLKTERVCRKRSFPFAPSVLLVHTGGSGGASHPSRRKRGKLQDIEDVAASSCPLCASISGALQWNFSVRVIHEIRWLQTTLPASLRAVVSLQVDPGIDDHHEQGGDKEGDGSVGT